MVLKSRKFWATVLGVISVFSLHFVGSGLPLADVADALKWLVGVFVAATAIEDGLKGGKVDEIAAQVFHAIERRAGAMPGPSFRSRN